MIHKFLKRSSDLIFAIILIIILIPLWIIISILIKIDSRGSVFFLQKRVGLNSQYFNIIKFRSMREGTIDLPAEELRERGKKVTRIGRFLRRFSIDEFPQLFNILKGDMSFIGPRPSHLGQVEQIKIRKEISTDKVRPGMSGLAQVNGRDDITIQEKAEFDRIYVYEYKTFMDFKIFLKTIKVVLTFKGGN
jgi:lipopolysaccharide/colanic/teichoic acid biosynthesis glycosyltransferase